MFLRERFPDREENEKESPENGAGGPESSYLLDEAKVSVVLERMTPEAKKIIERSLKQALQLGHAEIKPEHLFLAMLEDPFSVPVRALTWDSLTVQTALKGLRASIIRVLDADAEHERKEQEKKESEFRLSPQMVRELTEAVQRELLRQGRKNL